MIDDNSGYPNTITLAAGETIILTLPNSVDNSPEYTIENMMINQNENLTINLF